MCVEFGWAPDYWHEMPWVTFVGWQRYARKRSLERSNAEKRHAAGMDARPAGPASDEWQAYQDELKSRG